jgi:hypothetical protein
MDRRLRKDQMIQLISYIFPQIYYNYFLERINRLFNKLSKLLRGYFGLFVLEFIILRFLIFVNLKLGKNQSLLILFLMKEIENHLITRVILIASLLKCLLLSRRLYFDKR